MPLAAWLLKSFLALAAAAALLAPAACVTNPDSNANSAVANSNTGSVSADSNASSNLREPIYAKEPDQYSETISVTVEPTAQDKQDKKVAVPPLQFDFARLGGDRRAAFKLPTLGEVIYLEHAGLKYIVLPARKQYIELDQETLGVELPKLSLMTPTAVVEHLKSSAQYYKLGAEDVNGRPAIKYRFSGKLNTQTAAGNIDTDSSVYLDETTGLPVRAEIVGSTPGGAGARVTLQMSNVQLAPDRAEFDVPIGFRKVTSGELRQQVNSLANTMRIVALALTSQMAPAPGPSTSPASATPQSGSVSPTPVPRGSPTPGR